MKRFASHRLYIPHMGLLLKNQVVEVTEGSGKVISCYPFTEEISFTEWLGGLIVLSDAVPILNSDYNDIFKTCSFGPEDIKRVPSLQFDDTLLYAYYISDFNVSEMKYSDKSRIIKL